MRRKWFAGLAVGLLALAAPLLAQDAAEPVEPPPHVSGWPGLATGRTQGLQEASFSLGPELQRGRSPRELLRERRRLDAAVSALAPQRPGVVDAYVIAVALDSDPVFAREAREAGKVLSRRYAAEERTLVLAGPDGRSAGLPKGSISSLLVALAQVAEIMDPAEDVLVLYSTSHGAQLGLAYHDGDQGYGILSPELLKAALEELGIERRLLMLSACYSGVFVPHLASDNTAILTAASSERPSFGCLAQNDWTFFGDALINNALRRPQGLADAASQAQRTIAGWESDNGLDQSNPQVSIGRNVPQWLAPLEARMPRTATQPVGRPSIDSL